MDPGEREYTIIIRNLWKSYRDGRGSVIHALKGIDFHAAKGEMIVIHGPSGSGKTTLLKIIAGLEKPDRGVVVVGGYDLGYLDDDQLAMIRNTVVGYIPQDYGLVDELSVAENIELPLLIAGIPKSERHRRVKEIASYIGLTDLMSRPVKSLSGGQKQRVAIARALVNTPKIILADEPTANLDWDNSAKIMELFKHVKEDFETTVVIVSHDPRVTDYADRLLTMSDGKLKEY